jgi:hypothetical protein
MIKCRIIYAVAAVGALAMSQLAYASLPVPFEVVGCVKDGDFSSKGHIFPIRKESGDADLTAYEGKTIEITGFLNPGDRLSIGKVRIVAADCQQELQRSKLLCDPCITQ